MVEKRKKRSKKTGPPDRPSPDFRKRAERKYREKKNTGLKTPPPDEIEALLHELGVHQIELEMQNEALRETQAALEASRDRYADLYDAAPVGYFTLNDQGIILEANLTGAGLLGIEREWLIGKPFLLFVAEESRNTFYAHLRTVLRSRSRQRHEIGIRRTIKQKKREAAFFYAALESSFIETAGGEGRCRMILSDIAERKRAEDLLQRQAEELEKANRIKDEFLATLSHELRTPLNSILGWASLLRERKRDEATLARALEVIERNAKAQNKLIEDMLDVSRIIMGRLRLEVNQVEFIRIIHAAVDAARPVAEAKGVELVLRLDPSANMLWGDLNRLQQVVWNLLSNAIKFSYSGGRVEVRLMRVGSQIQLQIQDAGEGIDPAFLTHVFDRFRQADNAPNRSKSGLGLGLSIVRHLVELHGGSVRAESPGKGQGATFFVELPLGGPVQEQEQNIQRRSESAKAYPALDDVKVLVIDDEADARDLIRSALESCNALVTTAGSMREALEAFGKSKPDVVVSDIGMSEEDGYVLIQKLRALEGENGNRVPAVALTAYAREEDRAQALSAGYQIHLSKPIEPEHLARVIASLTGRGA